MPNLPSEFWDFLKDLIVRLHSKGMDSTIGCDFRFAAFHTSIGDGATEEDWADKCLQWIHWKAIYNAWGEYQQGYKHLDDFTLDYCQGYLSCEYDRSIADPSLKVVTAENARLLSSALKEKLGNLKEFNINSLQPTSAPPTAAEPDLPSYKGLRFDYNLRQVCVDGVWVSLSEEQNIMWNLLWEAAGQWTPGVYISPTANKTKHSMPDLVKDEIIGDTHHGYRLKRFIHT